MKPTFPIVLAVVLLALVGLRFGSSGGRVTTQSFASEARLEVALDGEGPRFAAIDITLDSRGSGLAAYQVELRSVVSDGSSPKLTFVGVEGGEHTAFASPPTYDPEALRGPSERLVLAALAPSEMNNQLPVSDTRVARVHVMIEGKGSLVVRATLIAAGKADGTRIDAAVLLAAASKEQVVPGGLR